MTDNKKIQENYFAFISYNRLDSKWGRRLVHKMEGFRLSKKQSAEFGLERAPIKKVFFAPNEIQLGDLDEELKERLHASQNLIVVSSPNSAKSVWVGKEIEYFHKLGRTKNIFFFIVDGVPHSGNPKTECYHEKLKELNIKEILGANINYDEASRWPWIRKEHAYIQLITTLLGIPFDRIWQRHKRQLYEKVAAWIAAICAVIATIFAVWFAGQPVDIGFTLNEASYINKELPAMHNAVISISLDNEIKTDTIKNCDEKCIFKNIPAKFIGKEVGVSIKCEDFHDVDTVITLATGNTLNIYRDEKVYGNINFRLWDVNREQALSNTVVMVDGVETTSDEEGFVHLSLPIEKQKSSYKVTTPASKEAHTIYMPSSDYNAILIE